MSFSIKELSPSTAQMVLLLLTQLSCVPQLSLAPSHCGSATQIQLETQDGAEVVLHRHAASGPPVLVIHGISSNRHFWDLTEAHSLPLLLSESGIDAWTLDLRGHGDAMTRKDGVPQTSGWTIDDYGRFDLAAALAHIQATTGHSKVAVVGHSMGGMVAAAYHAHHGDEALAALVVVGSPLTFESHAIVNQIKRLGAGIGRAWPSVETHQMAKLAAATLPLPGEHLLYTRGNMTPMMRDTMLSRVVSPVSRDELRHVQTILKAGRFVSADGSKDYLQSLQTLDIPLLAIAGSNDHVAPPDAVRPWVTSSASPDESFWTIGQSEGFSADYGHLDLVLGLRAREDVLFPIVEWLEQRLLR